MISKEETKSIITREELQYYHNSFIDKLKIVSMPFENFVPLDAKGSSIYFPYKPYKCQVDYMKQCIKALELGANALLESPTGTGKVKYYFLYYY